MLYHLEFGVEPFHEAMDVPESETEHPSVMGIHRAWHLPYSAIW